MEKNGIGWEGIPNRDYSIRKEKTPTIIFNKWNSDFQRVTAQVSVEIEGKKIRVNWSSICQYIIHHDKVRYEASMFETLEF